jgi:hypothetical protein
MAKRKKLVEPLPPASPTSSDMFAAMDQDPWADNEPEVSQSMAGRFKDAQSAMRYMMAGKAIITIRSVKTGTRFTYRLRLKEPEEGQNGTQRGPVTFVGVLTGPENTSNYQYLGHIFSTQGVYWHGRKSKISKDAPAAKAFDWTFKQLSQGKLPDVLEIWHEGSCGRCGRTLTVPESISSGFGPECVSKVGR